jgi:hypothetical protein
VADELQNGWSSINTHTVNTEVAVLAVATKTDLDKCIWITPESAVHSDPALTVFALMLDA